MNSKGFAPRVRAFVIIAERRDVYSHRLLLSSLGSLAECDGPASIMLLVVPSLAVYMLGAIYYAVFLKGARRGVLTMLCALMILAAGGKTLAAYCETTRPMHRSACGGGW